MATFVAWSSVFHMCACTHTHTHTHTLSLSLCLCLSLSLHPATSHSQGSHKNLKTEFHDFSMTDLLLSMTPILIWFQIWLWLSHNLHDNHKLESCHSHENKQFHGFLWHPATSHDFLGNFHIPRLFHDFPWRPFFPGFSMTMGTLTVDLKSGFGNDSVVDVPQQCCKMDTKGQMGKWFLHKPRTKATCTHTTCGGHGQGGSAKPGYTHIPMQGTTPNTVSASGCQVEEHRLLLQFSTQSKPKTTVQCMGQMCSFYSGSRRVSSLPPVGSSSSLPLTGVRRRVEWSASCHSMQC